MALISFSTFVPMFLVVRARCFADADERDHFYNLPDDEQMPLDYILDTLIADLATKKR